MTFDPRSKHARGVPRAVRLIVALTVAGAAFAGGLSGALLPGIAWAVSEHEGHLHHEPPPMPAREKKIEPRIPDTVLIDQDGKEHRFYSDLVKGKTVLMNAVYTSCPGVCPIQTTVFSRVQKLLGDRVGKDVQIISVTLDPVTDTPERLKEFSERFDVGPGWVFLTGSKHDVAEVLQAMDLYSPVPEQHTPIASIGNEPGAVWMKIINITSPGEIVSRIEHVEALGERSAAAP